MKKIEKGDRMTKTVFYHIYINVKNDISTEKVESKIDFALDWFKYDKGLYIIHSTSDVKKWMTRLKPLVESGGNLFICELNVSKRNGWMNKKFWEWLKNTDKNNPEKYTRELL